MLLNTGGKTPKLPPNIKYLDILNNEVRAKSTLFCRHIKFCKQNTVMLIVLREN